MPTHLLKALLISILFLTPFLSYGQTMNADYLVPDSLNITFQDTVFNIAFDSMTHNFGPITPTQASEQVVKYFKYLGTTPMIIQNAWTGDPHFICKYPRYPLMPNQIYSYTICFVNRGRRGRLNKKMGFMLSDGNRIILTFKGEYVDGENE